MISIADIKPSIVSQKSNASNSDIRKVIDKMLPIAAEQTKEIASDFRGSSDTESARKIWMFLKNNIVYVADGSNQVVKAPSALLRDKVGDCKSYTVFTSGILTNLGIPHRIVYTSYDKNSPEPGHVYVVTKDGVIIDAVWHKFNSEKKPIYRYEKIMNVKGITGIGSPMIGEIKERSQLKHAAAISTLAASRNAFLAMVRLNIAGIASVLNLKLAQSWDNQKREGKPGTPEFVSNLFNTWYNMGGDPSALQSAITAGEAKKVAGIKILDELNKRSPGLIGKYYAALDEAFRFYLQRRGLDLREKKSQRTAGIGGEPVTTAGATTVSIPVWLQVLQILSATIIAVAAGSDQQRMRGEFETDLDRTGNEDSGDGGGFSMAGGITPLLIAGGLAAALFLTGKKSN